MLLEVSVVEKNVLEIYLKAPKSLLKYYIGNNICKTEAIQT